RDYYIFKEGKEGNPPNNWVSFFEGSAWEYNEATDDYYLHYFTRRQPDLNWENPQVREALYEVMRFWLDKGVNGFRFDVIPLISKDLNYPDIPADEDGRLDFVRHYANGPRVHEFLQEMYEKVLQHYDCYTVGEGIGISTQEAAAYVAPERKELDSIYHFDHMVLDRDMATGKATPLPLVQFKSVIREWDEALVNKGWNTFYLGNHDQPRAVSRFGNDSPAYRELSAKMLMTLLFTQKAIPYLYQGDELGMTNTHFETVQEFDDVHVRNMYKELLEKEGDEEEFLARMNTNSRDHARTPFLWNAEKQAGFTEGEQPWIKINPNHTQINAQASQTNPESVWHYTKKMIQVRKTHSGLIYGDYEDLAPEHPSLFLYKRSQGSDHYLVLLNFSDQEQDSQIALKADRQLIIANYGDHPSEEGSIKLRPYEAIIFKY
ncbi:MAG: alpha-amylase family glycosyl hydrolase, partial [Bacteroidota bacterium]